MKAMLDAEGIAVEVDSARTSVDLVVVNTCAVTERAAAKSRHLISRMTRCYPDAIVVAAGCLAQLDPQSLADISGVDCVVGTSARFHSDWWMVSHKRDHPVRCGESSKPPIIIVDDDPINTGQWILGGYSNRSRPLLKIQDGCDQNCTYCIIPKLRGSPRSIPINKILSNAQSLLQAGAEEIVLTGVRIGSWGNDTPDQTKLVDLVRELIHLPGRHRVRLGSVEPWELNEELLELIIYEPPVCSHLHIPLQHTHPAVLERMGRPPLGSTFKLLREATRIDSSFAIGSDLIIGFPGETESEFNRLKADIIDLPLAYLHTFGYSPRPGTIAAGLPNQIPIPLTKKRVAQILSIGKQKRNDFNVANIGRQMIVIPEHPKNGSESVQAITDNYIRTKIPYHRDQIGRQISITLSYDGQSGWIGKPI